MGQQCHHEVPSSTCSHWSFPGTKARGGRSPMGKHPWSSHWWRGVPLLEMLLDRLLVLLLEVMATLEELEELLLELLEVEVLELQLAMPWKTLFQEGKAKARARASSAARVEKVSLEAKAAREAKEAR